ncbi:MAG: hypothetical protein Q9171_003818 [Xanthocarpia ochracea]
MACADGVYNSSKQSPIENMALAGIDQLPNDHLLADRSTNNLPGHLHNHSQQLKLTPPPPEKDVDDLQLRARANRTYQEPRGKGGSRPITARQYYRNFLRRRKNRYNRKFRSGPKGHRFLTDAWANCELNDLNWVRQNQQHFRVDKYSAFQDGIAYDDNVAVGDIGKERIIEHTINEYGVGQWPCDYDVYKTLSLLPSSPFHNLPPPEEDWGLPFWVGKGSRAALEGAPREQGRAAKGAWGAAKGYRRSTEGA